MPVLAYIVVAVAAYLLGSIPTGFLVAKAKGIDIRAVGSGNIGATNAMRVLGKPAGIFVLLIDALKGWVAVRGLAFWIANNFFPYDSLGTTLEFCAVLAGICVVIGHNYTCWLKFKGGKGIATTAGVYLVLAPWALLIALGVFILAVAITRYVSVGSIAAAIALPIGTFFTQSGLLVDVATIVLGLLAIYKHKSNIQRLMSGTESRLGKKSEDAK
ncbi:MAG TPA: glycerol-3-phosphate 1-O-acyltransferase PlsY [Dongiaceae bacterium]|nr:glycerol-3-phosphate 1-O-acyltransferase PlsY [Dongiaceae bacterium]